MFEDKEATIPEMKERIAKARRFLDTLQPAQFEGVEKRRVTMKLMGDTLEFAAPAYLLHFATPNFYFHQVSAYAILRSMGVQIGKRDYMGHDIIKE